MSVVRAYKTVLGPADRPLVIGASGLMSGTERTGFRTDAPQEDATQAHLILDELFEKVLAGRAPGRV